MDALRALWSARSVAVVGASTSPGAPGRLAVEFLLRYGYSGAVIPVHPSAAEIAGRPAYPSVAASPGAELALIVVPPAAVPAAVADCAVAGVRVAIVGTSGFGETGPDGLAVQQALAARARSAGMRLVGPNCIGAVGFASGQVASFSPLFSGERTALRPGGIGFASASGALGFGMVSLALERGMGLLAAVTTGNEADVTALEVLAALAAEPGCIALLGYLESLADGPALAALAAARQATGVPVALLVAGRSPAGARAAATHTGVLATADRVVDGALRQLGIVRVSDVDELLDVGDAVTLARPPRGSRVAVVTTSGGSGILAADAVAAHGLRLAALAPSTMDALRAVVPPYGAVANPVDVTAAVMRDRTLVSRALAAVAADPGVDLLVACFCVLAGSDVAAVVSALAETAATSGKPVLAARTGADHLAPEAGAALRAAGIPTYPTPARAVRAAAALCQSAPAAVPSRSGPPGPALPAATSGRSARAVDGSAGEWELKAWLAEAGVCVPRGRVVHDPADAPAAVAACGEPAVLKVVVPGLAHKSEVGGVVTGVSAAGAAAVAHRLRQLPGATGVLVEEQVPAGVELLVGVLPSPLGPVLTVGAGGVLTEALDDAAVRLLPVTEADVRDQLAQTRVARLLAAHRGRPAADVDAFVDLVLRVAGLAASLPPGAALDLNPVVVHADGAVVLDAAITVDAPAIDDTPPAGSTASGDDTPPAGGVPASGDDTPAATKAPASGEAAATGAAPALTGGR